MENCKYCRKNQAVPVLDEEIEQQSRPGNKFRRFCLSCERWLPMCSAKYFRTHPNPHVLPVGADEIIPLSESEAVERYPISDLAGRDTESSGTSRLSGDEERAVRDREMRNEILVDCILDLVLEEIIDKETATQYLSQKLSA